MTDEESREPPIGEAKKLDELAREKWREHLLLFSQVKNTVLEVNPHVNIPVKLKEGKPSPLGLFAEAAFEEKPGELPKGKRVLEVWPKHRRSALLGRVIFADDEKRRYRDIDIKGVGSFCSGGEELEKRMTVYFRPGTPSTQGREGLLDFDTAFFCYQISEKFIEVGIRTCRTIAIIELKQFIVDGHKFSLKQAREEDLLDKDFRPVVEIRAFGTKARIENLEPWVGLFNGQRLLFGDAKKFVAQELGYKKISSRDYFIWFAKTLGTNVGLIHKNGWSHHNLRPHNITLDCRIVDLDTVTQLTTKNEQSADFQQARDSLSVLTKSLGLELRMGEAETLKKYFEESYDAAFPSEEREQYFKRVSKEK